MQPPIHLLAARAGFEAPGTELFEWPAIWHLELLGVDLSINRVVLLTFLVVTVIIALFLVAFRNASIVPRGLQNLMEIGVEFVRRNIILEIIGPQGLKYLPYLCTVFFFILFSNLLEVTPGITFPITSKFGLPVFLAIFTLLLFVGVGIKAQGFGHYFRNTLFPSSVPPLAWILIAPIEIISMFLVRPFTLSVRLMANMVAGHLILAVFFFGAHYLAGEARTAVFAAGAVIVAVPIMALELAVALMQAYVFTILTAVYLAGSLEPEH